MSDALNLNPEGFQEGGGLIDDVDATLTELRFEEFDYQGKANPVPALKVTADVSGEEYTQFYSMGRLQDWIPSDDGKQLLRVGQATSIRLTSNGGIFLKSLVDSGFPGDKLGDDISVVDGTQVHLVQVPEPTRSGIQKTKEQKDREEKYGPKTILVVSEVQTLPWEKSKPAGKKAAGGGKKASGGGKKATGGGKKSAGGGKKTEEKKAASEESSELEDKAIEWITEMLAESGSITKKEIPQRIFKERSDDDDKSDIIKLAFSDDFLENGPWNYEDGTLTL